MKRRADVVIVGAGIAGVSAAYHLSVRLGISDIVLVDPRPPLTLTSDKSTECYRNWWPDASMVGLMNRSIDIYEELAEEVEFGFNRNGYLFVTGSDHQVDAWREDVEAVRPLGASADILEPESLLSRYPFLTADAVGGLFVPRAGWFRAQDVGQWMLDRAREAGTVVLAETVTNIDSEAVTLGDGTSISTDTTVVAAGPLSAKVAAMAGVDLPLFSELHLKVAFKDHLGLIPREAPMTIWSDIQTIDWSTEEREGLEELGRTDLLGEMPIFCHFRPEGGT
ncbi:MAG TPA: FAD-dependent oxidoreductase, partial [Acidimicrobiia bacterium]|nr:FAD-dependent oxidoreductase [Acidimicrobiia bacterium]